MHSYVRTYMRAYVCACMCTCAPAYIRMCACILVHVHTGVRVCLTDAQQPPSAQFVLSKTFTLVGGLGQFPELTALICIIHVMYDAN